MLRPTIALCSNTAWNLTHFRRPVLSALVQRGYRVVCIAPPDSSVEQLRGLGCEFRPLVLPAHGRNPAAELLLLLRLARLLADLKPAALLTYTVKPNIYGALVGRVLGIPVICNISGLGTAFLGRKWLGRLVTLLYRISLRGAHMVFFQNPDDRLQFVQARLVRVEQTRLIPGSGLDLNAFSPPARSQMPQATTFVFVGRMLVEKGVAELIDAAWQLRAARSGAFRFRILLVGGHDAHNPASIPIALLRSAAERGGVEWVGQQPDVRSYLEQADCVILPSYREGAPRALIEAAAMGIPLIATDVPGCREVVQPGVNGLLCAARSADALAKAMAEFLELSMDARAAMGQASRRLAEERFDEARVVNAYLETLSAVLLHPGSIGSEA